MWLREYFHMFPNYGEAASFLGCRLEMRSPPTIPCSCSGHSCPQILYILRGMARV